MHTLIVELAATSVLLFALTLFAVQAAAAEIGLRLGLASARNREAPREGVGVIVGGMLGLLAFMLALTLAHSSSRFQERRATVAAEANAIGTAWLRAQAVGGPRGLEIARLLEDYTRLRMRFVQAGALDGTLDDINRRTMAMQSEIWGHVSAIVREQPNPVTNALMTSVNETFDVGTESRFAFSLGIPPLLFWLLTGTSALSIGALGYQLGQRNQRVRIMSLILIGMWTAIITLILDLGAPRVGDLRVGTTVHEWALQGFQGGITIPPLPAR